MPALEQEQNVSTDERSSTTPQADPAISQAAPSTPQPAIHTGIPTRRLTSISINPTIDVRLNIKEEREVMQLTQEKLEELWAKLIEECKDDEKLHDLIADKKVELKNNNLFHILVPNMLLDNSLREYQTRILGFLRDATNNESLQYKAAVVVENVAVKAYLPRDKFDEMAQRNPAMLSLRKLFPDIDF